MHPDKAACTSLLAITQREAHASLTCHCHGNLNATIQCLQQLGAA
jgi:hypothetical protein